MLSRKKEIIRKVKTNTLLLSPSSSSLLPSLLPQSSSPCGDESATSLGSFWQTLPNPTPSEVSKTTCCLFSQPWSPFTLLPPSLEARGWPFNCEAWRLGPPWVDRRAGQRGTWISTTKQLRDFIIHGFASKVSPGVTHRLTTRRWTYTTDLRKQEATKTRHLDPGGVPPDQEGQRILAVSDD